MLRKRFTMLMAFSGACHDLNIQFTHRDCTKKHKVNPLLVICKSQALESARGAKNNDRRGTNRKGYSRSSLALSLALGARNTKRVALAEKSECVAQFSIRDYSTLKRDDGRK
jgi:hypothetical protein